VISYQNRIKNKNQTTPVNAEKVTDKSQHPSIILKCSSQVGDK
jgi:hypothetical protein